MQKKHLNFLVLAVIMSITSAKASSTASISALKSPVWLQQGGSRTELGPGSKLKIGDNISTGDAGRVELMLWVNARLQLNSNSEITLRNANGVAQSAADARPELYIHEGRACVSYTARSSGEAKFVINIGDMMFAAMHLRGDICVLRADGQSSIKLRDGSVQVTHAVDPNMIILSEVGTEFHIDDNGSFKLLFPGDDVSTLEIEKPFIVETIVEKADPGEPPEIVASDQIDTGELTQAEFEATGGEGILANTPDSENKSNAAVGEPGATATAETPRQEESGYIYTVYLFSTRDAEVAEQVNRSFQRAGHDTRVIESTSGGVLRYRVVAPGFESWQAAQNFSDAIVGTLGVTQTWIGKEKPSLGSGSSAAVEGTATQAGAAQSGESSNYVYTVYLFATREVKAAERLNRKLQQAGHATRVLESPSGSAMFYRVAATDFESRQAARNFSDAIVGTLGVTETWIGRELR